MHVLSWAGLGWAEPDFKSRGHKTASGRAECRQALLWHNTGCQHVKEFLGMECCLLHNKGASQGQGTARRQGSSKLALWRTPGEVLSGLVHLTWR